MNSEIPESPSRSMGSARFITYLLISLGFVVAMVVFGISQFKSEVRGESKEESAREALLDTGTFQPYDGGSDVIPLDAMQAEGTVSQGLAEPTAMLDEDVLEGTDDAAPPYPTQPEEGILAAPAVAESGDRDSVMAVKVYDENGERVTGEMVEDIAEIEGWRLAKEGDANPADAADETDDTAHDPDSSVRRGQFADKTDKKFDPAFIQEMAVIRDSIEVAPVLLKEAEKLDLQNFSNTELRSFIEAERRRR